jgi:hypothetical protein
MTAAQNRCILEGRRRNVKPVGYKSETNGTFFLFGLVTDGGSICLRSLSLSGLHPDGAGSVRNTRGLTIVTERPQFYGVRVPIARWVWVGWWAIEAPASIAFFFRWVLVSREMGQRKHVLVLPVIEPGRRPALQPKANSGDPFLREGGLRGRLQIYHKGYIFPVGAA